jgi:hypothetical protein
VIYLKDLMDALGRQIGHRLQRVTKDSIAVTANAEISQFFNKLSYILEPHDLEELIAVYTDTWYCLSSSNATLLKRNLATILMEQDELIKNQSASLIRIAVKCLEDSIKQNSYELEQVCELSVTNH